MGDWGTQDVVNWLHETDYPNGKRTHARFNDATRKWYTPEEWEALGGWEGLYGAASQAGAPPSL